MEAWPGEGEHFRVNAVRGAIAIAARAVPAGRSAVLCHPVRTGADAGGALPCLARPLILRDGLAWHPVDATGRPGGGALLMGRCAVSLSARSSGYRASVS
jgi:hypothetical protein